MIIEYWPWIAFGVFVFGMLALDLGVFHKSSHEVKLKEALIWSAVWVSLAFVFNMIIFATKGHDAGMQFLAGYLIEKSLSVDNIFVFIMIFSFFKIPPKHQHHVLFWGILGALFMRAIFIAGGIALLERFHWMMYVFGGFLVFTGIKMAFSKSDEHSESLDDNAIIKFLMKVFPVAKDYHGDKFFVRQNNRACVSGLFLALVFIEISDLIFAVDSIPAVLAVSKDPFIVYTSNIFAILGLRALYFAVAGVIKLFEYLHYGLAIVLVFVGFKMLIADHYKFPIGVSLSVIAGVLAISILISYVANKKKIAAKKL